MSGDAFGIHIGLAIPSCANRHAGPSQLAGAPHTGPAGRTHGLVNPPNETCASSSALRAGAARPESEEHRTRRADRKNDVNDPKRTWTTADFVGVSSEGELETALARRSGDHAQGVLALPRKAEPNIIFSPSDRQENPRLCGVLKFICLRTLRACGSTLKACGAAA
jgi:hypothetical protein